MRTTYRDCQAIILYDREKLYFPETQEMVVAYRIKTNRKQLLKDIRKARADKDDEGLSELRQRLAISSKLNPAKSKKEDTSEVAEKKSPPIRTYILPCTHADCKGTLISEEHNEAGNYVCVICTGVTCSRCNMMLHEPAHECDPDVLKTVKMLESSSKPCPTCSVRIHKISGCNQMFCTLCKCVFDWATLKIERGFMHNPHYLEWRKTNRDTGIEDSANLDDPNIQHCQLTLDVGIWLWRLIGTMSHIPQMEQLMDTHFPNTTDTTDIRDQIGNLVRVAVHHRHYTLPRLDRVEYTADTNRDVRLKLLSNEMSEEDFKKMAQRRSKKILLDCEHRQIIYTFVAGMDDLVLAVRNNQDRTIEDIIQMIASVIDLEDYVDQCMSAVCTAYHVQPRNISHYY
jgi:hypothetical protein